MRYDHERATRWLFAVYAVLVPGSSLLVARDQVPDWGLGFGGVLLLLQGASMLAWLSWRYGRRGLLTGLLVALLGFAIEYIGETSGFPFGRYRYTELVQPQLFTVPVAICAAWMMVASSSFEIAKRLVGRWGRNAVLLLTATLVLLLDLQIETVAALINDYWVWIDKGPYYGVPTANFVAWWLVGLGMAAVLWRLLQGEEAQSAKRRSEQRATNQGLPTTNYWRRLTLHIPAALYLLSTAMFTIINLAHGYFLAGMIGVSVLLAALALNGAVGAFVLRQTARRRYD